MYTIILAISSSEVISYIIMGFKYTIRYVKDKIKIYSYQDIDYQNTMYVFASKGAWSVYLKLNLQ